MNNEHPDEYLYPLESEPDAFNRTRWAMAYAVAHTTGFYVDEFKEHGDSIRFTIHDYRDAGFCADTWHAIDADFVTTETYPVPPITIRRIVQSIEMTLVIAMPQEGLQNYFTQLLNTLPRWGEDNGATGKTIQGEPPQ